MRFFAASGVTKGGQIKHYSRLRSQFWCSLYIQVGVHVTVTTVDSVNKALEFLGLLDGQQQEIDVNLIITNYCMPGMTGYDLLKKIKESHLKDIPVVIMLLRIVLISLSWDKLILNNSYLSMVMKTGLISGIISLTEGVAVGRTFASLKDYKVDGNM
ncbi:hypothetical protein J5N97_022630 [Dioscorea zingiberensis]|uniref:Response regulatory domain-containing protein n=1 Tax=Dioscorea zingiberensis TaxID=325984 RepID=A0A9D5HB64_9LILI|nr:hypothetical protein J5N97_022630 [Dioscorea zingiberensis]